MFHFKFVECIDRSDVLNTFISWNTYRMNNERILWYFPSLPYFSCILLDGRVFFSAMRKLLLAHYCCCACEFISHTLTAVPTAARFKHGVHVTIVHAIENLKSMRATPHRPIYDSMLLPFLLKTIANFSIFFDSV